MSERFAKLPLQAILDHRLGLIDLRVLGAVYSFGGKPGDIVWPTRDAIASRCGYSASRVSNAITQLVKLGWLQRTQSSRGPNSYILLVPAVPESVTVTEPATVPESVTVTEPATVPESGISQCPIRAFHSARIGHDIRTDQEQTKNRPSVAVTPLPPVDELTSARRRGEMSARLRGMGVNVTTVNPHLCGWVDAQVTDAELDEAVAMARVHKPEPQTVPAAYLARIVEELVSGRSVSPIRPATGPPPTRRASGGYKTVEQQNREAAIRAKAMLFGDKGKVIEGEVIRD